MGKWDAGLSHGKIRADIFSISATSIVAVVMLGLYKGSPVETNRLKIINLLKMKQPLEVYFAPLLISPGERRQKLMRWRR